MRSSNGSDTVCITARRWPVLGSVPMIGNALDEAAFSDKETKQRIIRDLAARPDEALESIRTVLTTPQKRRWGVAVQVIRAIGYPRNVLAIPELVDQVSDLNSPARNESIQALTEMERSVVVPHLMKALLDSHQTREYWPDAIAGSCSMLARVGREYALACVPAVAYLLSQNIPPH